MSMRDPGLNLLRKSFAFCMCFIVFAAMTPCSRASGKNHALRHSVQSHAGSLTPQPAAAIEGVLFAPAYGNLPARFIENRKQAEGQAAIHGAWFCEADFLIHRRFASSLKKAKGKIGGIRPGPANPQAIHAARRARKLSEGHASYLRVRLFGVDRGVEVAPGDAPPVKPNCFAGDAPGKGPANIPTRKTHLYRKTRPKTDSKPCGDKSPIEYGSVAKPGADPGGVRLEGSGEQNIRLTGAAEVEAQ